MKDRLKNLIIPVSVFAVSLILIYYLVPDFHPFGGLNIKHNEPFILGKVCDVLSGAGIEYDKERFLLTIESNTPLIRWMNSRYPLNTANSLLRKSGQASYWQILEMTDSDSDFVISDDTRPGSKESGSVLNIRTTMDGRILSFSTALKESSLKDKVLSVDQAKQLAVDFVSIFGDDRKLEEVSAEKKNDSLKSRFIFKQIETFQKPDRTDYKITWLAENGPDDAEQLTVFIKGDRVESFSFEILIPEEFRNYSPDIFQTVTEVIFILLVIVLVLVVGFKRFRAFEIGFRLAIIFGILILISFVAREILERYYGAGFGLIFGLIFGGFIIAGAAVILWAVSETLFREVWNDKFLSLDLIRNKILNHSIVGKALSNGIAYGFGLTAMFFLLLRIISGFVNVSFSGEYFNSLSHLNSGLPLLNLTFGVLNSYAMLAAGFFILLTSALKRYIVSNIVFIFVSGMMWTILIHSGVNPAGAGIPVNMALGIALSLILIKYDLLTVMLSYLIFHFLIKASQFAFIGEVQLSQNWLITVILFFILMVLGFIFLLTRDRFTDFDSIKPKFVENITERQRLKKELEVARHVQMSFLPGSNPVIEGLEIASICIPAQEVGGDYYDFVAIGKDRTGIIIGDVSGKGTQAAFYMTLTKGFIKAIAKQTDSPAEVLARMNELFYENVERGRFISMIYAVIDMEDRTMRIARAGHNPVIMQDGNGKVNLINPKGLAIGLEKGILFRDVISEHEEELIPGKNFIFYTDGFTEAVNRKGEEYGLSRLSAAASENSGKSAQEIMNNILEGVKKFIGKARQHDDMTVVVLKVK